MTKPYKVPKVSDLPGAHLLPEDLQIDYTREIVWNITQECNLRCPHCYSDAGKKADNEITTEQAKKIIDHLTDSAEKRGERWCICWAGGEPLARKDIFELMEHAHKRDFPQHIVTNGTLVDKDVAKKLKDFGMYFTCFSIDSFKSETHDRIKGQGSMRKSLKAIELCQEAGIYQVPLCVMTKNNFPELKEFREECLKRFGCEPYFDRLVNIGRAKGDFFEKQALSREELQQIYDWRYSQIRDYIHKGDTMKVPVMALFDMVPFMDTPEASADKAYLEWGVGCQACRFWLGISHNGDVWPCFRTPLPLGNLLEQSLDEIENGELFQKIRDRRGKTGKCAECKHLPLCGGGCLSDCMGLTGDPFAEYPLCWYDPKTGKENRVTHRANAHSEYDL